MESPAVCIASQQVFFIILLQKQMRALTKFPPSNLEHPGGFFWRNSFATIREVEKEKIPTQ